MKENEKDDNMKKKKKGKKEEINRLKVLKIFQILYESNSEKHTFTSLSLIKKYAQNTEKTFLIIQSIFNAWL